MRLKNGAGDVPSCTALPACEEAIGKRLHVDGENPRSTGHRLVRQRQKATLRLHGWLIRLSAPRDHRQRPVRKRPVQPFGLIPGCPHPDLALFLSSQDHRHRRKLTKYVGLG
jgi:hypothetical protein